MSARLAASRAHMARARRVFVGGVNSPVRAFAAVGGDPVVMAKGRGPWLTDVDGNRYLDMVLSWGPLIAGHAHPAVRRAVARALRNGSSFGACHPLELELALRIRRAYPHLERLRFTSSGTEAAMDALRLARGATGRDLVVKFEGCYHGHSDGLLVRSGSGGLTLGVPDSAGVPDARLTVCLPYNDAAAVRAHFRAAGRRTAAVIVEPAAGNMGLVPPKPGFLETLRRETRAAGAMLVFDEVLCGFRLPGGSAARCFGVTADITCLGKVMGGGLPAAAFGGAAGLMERLAPVGPVYQAGTLSGNPLAMAAGAATLQVCLAPGFARGLNKATAEFTRELRGVFKRRGVEAQVPCLGSMWGVFFTGRPVNDLDGAKAADARRYARFFNAMLDQGVYLPPSAYETCFLSSAHGPRHLERALRAADRAVRAL